MIERLRNKPAGYALAILIVGLATVLRLALHRWFPEGLTYIVFSPGVMVAATLAGFGPGMVATLLSALCAKFFIIPPAYHFLPLAAPDLVGLCVFLLLGFLMSGVAGLYHRALEKTISGRKELANERRAADSLRESQEALRRTAEDLALTNEELEVSTEELRTQNEELVAIRNALEIERRRYQGLFEFAPEGYVVTDLNGTIGEANLAAANLFGMNQAALTGKPLAYFTAPKDHVAFCDRLPGLQQEARLQWEVTLRSHQGVEPETAINVSPICDSEDRPTGLRWLLRDISERKRAEEALRLSEERYRTLFGTLLEGFCIIEMVFDADGRAVDFRFLEINPAFEAQTGLRDAKGKLMSEVAPDTEARWYEIYGNVALTGEPARCVNEAKALNRWYDVSAYRVGGEESRRVGVLFNDITDRKRAEEALRESELFYRQTLESIPGMVFTTRPDGYCDYQSQQWVEYTGVPMSEHLGDGWNKLLHPEDRPRAFEAWQDAVEGRAPYDLEYRVRRHDGVYEWFRVMGQPIRDEEGRIVRWFGVAMNVEELKRGEQAQRESEERLAQAVRAAKLGIFEHDHRSGEIHVCEMFRDICGWREEEPVTLDAVFERTLPEYREGLSAAVQKSHDPAGDGFLFNESRMLRSDGTIVWLRAQGQTTFEGEGNARRAVRTVGTVMDITEQKRYEEQIRATSEGFRKASEELEQSNKDLEHFAYVASHDLQEPLRTVGSFAGMLKRRYQDKLDGDANEFIQYITDGATRMQTLIQDLLAYSRVGSQAKPLVPVQSEIVLDEALRALKEAISDNGAIVTRDPLPMVRGDSIQIAQLFQNLIGNALKFHREGVQPEVHISANENEKYWIFGVADNGIGIDPKYNEKIFTIFQRLHTADKYKGTGIGLAICKRIVERHGGEICVESKEGEGTVFLFTLPKA